MTSWLFPEAVAQEHRRRAALERRPRERLDRPEHLGLRGEAVPGVPERRLEHQRVALGHLHRLGRRRGLEVQVAGVRHPRPVRADDPQLRRPEDVPRRQQLEAQRPQLERAVVRDRERRGQRAEPVRHQTERRPGGDDPLVPGDVVRVGVAHEGERRLPVRVQPERRARQVETSAPQLDRHDVGADSSEEPRRPARLRRRRSNARRSSVERRRQGGPAGGWTHTPAC